MWRNVIAIVLGAGFAAGGLWLRHNRETVVCRFEGPTANGFVGWIMCFLPTAFIVYGAAVAAVAAIGML